MLGPVSSHTAAETRQVVASLGSQPTVAGHSGDHPPELETLRATPARPHQILIQGNLYSRTRATHADAKRAPAVAGVPSPRRYSRAITSVYPSGVATLTPGFSFSTSAIFAFE